MIMQKLGIMAVGTVILLVVLSAGCLGSTVQKPPVSCSVTLVPGQNMTINETQNNAVICAKPGSSLTLEVPDVGLTFREWIINVSPGLQITDEGLTYYWYAMNGTFLTTSNAPASDMYGVYTGHGIHSWNVTMTQTGVQTITGILQPLPPGSTPPQKTLNWTIVVS